MKIEIYDDKKTLGEKAALMAANYIRSAVEFKGSARIIAAGGASQFEFLAFLTGIEGLPWQHVTLFHLDEYVGLPDDHPASQRHYLHERLISKVGIGTYHLINPGSDPAAECLRVGRLLQEAPVDVAFVGIGENGHLAFNDPPADFETEQPYLVVKLDDLKCRQQQLGEGWFRSLDEIPSSAISMSIRQILKSRAILCTVPDARKAEAVRATLNQPVSPMVPASILRTHAEATLFLDKDSSSLLHQPSQSRH